MKKIMSSTFHGRNNYLAYNDNESGHVLLEVRLVKCVKKDHVIILEPSNSVSRSFS
jgi:hypothetical protein